MLKREISEKLKLWRTQKNKKALCIIGARQIGKTESILHFAEKYYKNVVYINFTDDKVSVKSAVTGLVVAAVSAGISAVMNLEKKDGGCK
mgnify:CR=1 FL=1